MYTYHHEQLTCIKVFTLPIIPLVMYVHLYKYMYVWENLFAVLFLVGVHSPASDLDALLNAMRYV